MYKRAYFVIAMLILCLSYAEAQAPQTPQAPQAPQSQALNYTLQEAALIIADRLSNGATYQSPFMLKKFYAQRDYAPAWNDERGPVKSLTEALFNAVRAADDEGLRPWYYHYGEMKLAQSRAIKLPSPERIADLDLLLTDAFLTFGSDLSAGRADSGLVDRETSEADLPRLLAETLDACMAERCRIEESLRGLWPPHPAYSRLKKALQAYRGMSPWPLVSGGPPLKKGASGRRVLQIKERLVATGDLAVKGPSPRFFDSTLEEAVKRFQVRHGLDPDGVAGPATLRAMNVPLEKRIRQIELNLERWRWFPRKPPGRFILVNSANFSLSVVEDGLSVLEMRVVVGKPYWGTPAFRAKMTYLVLNPTWRIPKKILKEEIAPKLRKDPGYLTEQGISLFRGEEEIAPETLDMKEASYAKLKNYLFVQRPGPLNPLGRIKFMFPNKHEIYLHDTPSKGLFERTVRTFSHGCIRIEKPMELAEYLLKGNEWDKEMLLTEMDEAEDKTVGLRQPIDVYIFYWTAWADDEGTVQFRQDVYERDEPLDAALGQY